MRPISSRTALFLAMATTTLLLSYHWLIAVGLLLIALMSILYEHVRAVPTTVIYAGAGLGLVLSLVGFMLQLGFV